MGAFSGLRDAARGYTSNPLRAGRYVARIDACDSFEAEQKGLMWKTTLTILAVDEGDHRVGEQVHVFYKKGQYPKLFLQNIKAFLAGVLDVADEEIGEEEAELAIGDDSPMVGLVTVVAGRQQASKSARDDDGNPVKYVRFSWEPSLSSEEIQAAIGEEGVAQFFPNGL